MSKQNSNGIKTKLEGIKFKKRVIFKYYQQRLKYKINKKAPKKKDDGLIVE